MSTPTIRRGANQKRDALIAALRSCDGDVVQAREILAGMGMQISTSHAYDVKRRTRDVWARPLPALPMPSPDLVPPPSPQDFGNLTSLCAYCSAPSATIDHVRPLARGGLDHPSNRVNACAPCNKEKGARILTELTGNRVWRIRIAHAVQTSLSVAAEYGRLMAQDLINEANRR